MENKIEYKVCDKFSGSSPELEDHLNAYGVDGWDAISIVNRGRNIDFPKNNDYVIVLKRPLTEVVELERIAKKTLLQRMGLKK